MFNTKFYKNRWRTLNFRRIWFFNFFLSWCQIIKIRCIYEAFSVRKPKSSNVLPWRNNFVNSVRKQYGNPDSHPFFLPLLAQIQFSYYLVSIRVHLMRNFVVVLNTLIIKIDWTSFLLQSSKHSYKIDSYFYQRMVIFISNHFQTLFAIIFKISTENIQKTFD